MSGPRSPQKRRPVAGQNSVVRAPEWLRTLATVGLLVTFYFVVPFGGEDDPLPLASATILAIAIALVLAALISRRILRLLDGTVEGGLSGLVILLAAVIVAFSLGYFLLSRSDPGQVSGLHTRLDALYFTLITLTTIGYGDVHPAGQAARAIASLQVVFNAIFLAGLVRTTLYQAKAGRDARGTK